MDKRPKELNRLKSYHTLGWMLYFQRWSAVLDSVWSNRGLWVDPLWPSLTVVSRWFPSSRVAIHDVQMKVGNNQATSLFVWYLDTSERTSTTCKDWHPWAWGRWRPRTLLRLSLLCHEGTEVATGKYQSFFLHPHVGLRLLNAWLFFFWDNRERSRGNPNKERLLSSSCWPCSKAIRLLHRTIDMEFSSIMVEDLPIFSMLTICRAFPMK